ncbi:type II toxin-antitoxin system RelE/ParE family toxin [Candidatus Accumulibacter phosphatis]|uniref:Type II toxin-antitoxin system RelE/ParE family toxin n=1 Tax=Candidatus Accumulibacter contiguus TaxID=2954381 RepID=A0ABX1T779_9PROT|nr:type II toxin-antitoxin system RelE/ParE family toxin [Candidatus Accumulibacter contiguus]
MAAGDQGAASGPSGWDSQGRSLGGSQSETERSVTRFAVEILPEAEAEVREAFLWYFDRSPIAAQAFRTETLEAIDRLAVDALMWPEDEDAIRRHVLRHFPYTVFYEILGSTVTVLAVAHQRRKPGYWHMR